MLLQTDSFAAFYALFPRHVARKAAEKAWSRVATSPEVIEQIMAGLRAQLPFMKVNEKKFVPYPATWLNQKRFEDEYDSWAGPPPRVLSCAKCGDTGVVWQHPKGYNLERCNCPIGQLPGVLAGVAEEAL